MHRIDAVRFGIAGGVIGALFCFILTLLATVNSYGAETLNILESLFLGYEISVFGSIIGGLWGFFWGFIKLFLIAFIYNLLGPTREVKRYD